MAKEDEIIPIAVSKKELMAVTICAQAGLAYGARQAGIPEAEAIAINSLQEATNATGMKIDDAFVIVQNMLGRIHKSRIQQGLRVRPN